jgi:multidrug resistance efflux pump
MAELQDSGCVKSFNPAILQFCNFPMNVQRISVSLFSLVAVVTIALAGATIWLFLTNPVTVANAINEGDVTPLVRNLAQVIYQALSGLLKYL